MSIINNVYKVEDGILVYTDLKLICLNIPEDVIEIGEYAFFKRASLEEITIPNSVKEIGRNAFEGCTSLRKVIISEGLEEIGDKAFASCTSLEEITIPNSVKKIGDNAFEGCKSLKRIILSEGLEEIGDKVFADCTSLKEITIPNSVKKIGEGTFYHCHAMKNLVLPEGLTEIGLSTIEVCTSLEEIKVPNSVTGIDAWAFAKCTSLKRIELPENLTTIGHAAFYGCDKLEEITILSNIRYIGPSCFKDCSALKNVNLSEGLEVIDDNAFTGCISLEEIYIPNSVTLIKETAFKGCNSLKKVHLSESVSLISVGTFSGCISLEEINIPGNIKEISEAAFLNCASLKKVNFSEGLKEIKDYVFDYCGSLEEITLPSTVTKLYPNAFFGCSSLKKISINNECNILFDKDKVTIEYLDINSLNINLIYAVLANKKSAKSIEFKSPNYSFLKWKEKEMFNKIFTKDRNITFIKDKNIKLPEVKKEEKNEDDIKHLEDEIIFLCKEFPKNIANIIIEKVNEIDKEYKKSIESFKPEYGKNNGDMFDYEGLKNNTYLSLNRIKSLINDLKDFILFAKSINDYKELINKKVESYSNDNDIESKIKNILYLSTFLDDNNSVKNTLISYLDDVINKINNYIIDKINGSTVLEESSLIKNELDNKINELLSSIADKVKDVPKYKLLCLYNILNEKEYKANIKDNDIIGFINGIRYSLDRLSSSEYSNKIRNDINSVINKYKDIIGNELNNNITNERFEQIEIELRKELHPFIIEIDKYAKIDKYEENGLNIYRQLEISFDLVNRKRYIDEELNNYNNNDILLEVINILKYIEEKKLDEETIAKIYNDINNVLSAIKSLLNETDVSVKDKYIHFMGVVTSKFTEVTNNINKYIKDVDVYNNSFGKK